RAAGKERLDERQIRGARQPLVLAVLPLLLGQHRAVRTDIVPGEVANGPMEALVREAEAERDARLRDESIPSCDTGLNLADKVVAQPLVERRERGNRFVHNAVAYHLTDVIARLRQQVVVLDLRLYEPSLQARGVVAGGVGR